ncbi:MAG: hypothetical protein RDV48_29945 [Candidatus Eremiobacteraeota bacterium]|nr:hypothetical protein [Candidatus Eremiobacteraeota bacterium]
MASHIKDHRKECLCPICRSARGETRRNKKAFTASINIALLEELREWAREKHTTLTGALEEAIRLLIKKKEHSREKGGQLIGNDPISPELAVKVDRLRKNKKNTGHSISSEPARGVSPPVKDSGSVKEEHRAGARAQGRGGTH